MCLVSVYLVRHRESVAQGSDLICGRSSGTPLTITGRKQAESLGIFWKKKDKFFSHAYASTTVRTQETARHCLSQFSPQIHLEIDENISEQSQGDWEGLSRKAIYQREEVKAALAQNNWMFKPGDAVKGESQCEVAQRMAVWLEKTTKAVGAENCKINIVLFTHAMAIKYLLAELLDRPRHEAYLSAIHNTSITKLRYQDGKFLFLQKENFTPHL